MRSIAAKVGLAISVLMGCGERGEPGGITARIVFEGRGLVRSASSRSLRVQSVPSGIARLEILALDVSGATLRETNLKSSPGPGELLLEPNGGTWRLERVPIGRDRRVVGRAYLGPSNDPRTSNLLLFEGEIAGIEVRSGELINIGVLTLRAVEGARFPPLDREPPDPPSPVVAAEVREGDALAITFGRPTQADLAGYVVAVGNIADSRTPTIARGAPPSEGSSLAPGFIITHVIPSPSPENIEIGDLENGRAYRVLVYAFDSDLDGRPLNHSRPAQALAVPRDSVPPNAPNSLSLSPNGLEGVRITFTAPGEDGETGIPIEYQIRTSTTRRNLESPESFGGAPSVVAPPVQPPGETVRFDRTFAELRFGRVGQFFMGLRAKDRAGLFGDVAIAAFTRNATTTPRIDTLSPEIVLASTEIILRGSGFGDDPGVVALTTTSTPSQRATLLTSRWSDTEIVALMPPLAESGLLSVTARSGGSDQRFVPVVLRLAGVIPGYMYPFELVAADRNPGPVIGALYREIDTGGVFEGAMERLLGLVAENDPLAELGALERSTAIAGTYVPQRDLFVFVASNAATSMTVATVSSATPTNEARIPVAVLAGGADRVSIIPLDGGTGDAIPAMLAFSRSGIVRTATVSDLRTQPFNLFTTYTSTVAELDRVTIARRTTTGLVMAYRSIGPGGPDLVVLTNAATAPGAFAIRPVLERPASGPNFEIVAVPIGGAAEEFIIGYEELDAQGLSDIRLIRLADYGLKRGYAPFPLAPGTSRRLEDIGLVQRQGETWLAVLSSQLGPGAELRYTEVPLLALDYPDTRRGEHAGLVLDSSTDASTRARLGCRLAALRACPIGWLGENAGVLFVRR